MPYYRCQSYFEGPYAGASEQFEFSDTRNNLLAVGSSLSELYQERCKMLAKGWSGIGYKTTKIATDALAPLQRQTWFTKLVVPAPAAATIPAPKDTSLKIVMFSHDMEQTRRANLCGIPQVICNGNLYESGKAWEALYGSWEQKMLAIRLGWISVTWSEKVLVTGYTVSDVGVVTVEVAAAFAAPPAPEQKFTVRIAGVNEKSEINGQFSAERWRAAPGGGFQFDLVGKFGLIPYQGGGTVRLYTPEWVPVGIDNDAGPGVQVDPASIHIEGVGKRQRGAPFGTGRGRVPARVRT